MKKVLSTFLALLMMFSVSFAQNKAPKKEVKPATEVAKMKKDGTPDMRYKENKDAAKAKKEEVKEGVKMKKDGTPDMRYKENKEAPKAKEKK